MQDKYGYVRVSSTDQNEDRQLIALREQGVQLPNIYIDKQSGRKVYGTGCFTGLDKSFLLNGLFVAIIALHSPFKYDIVVLVKWAVYLINRRI